MEYFVLCDGRQLTGAFYQLIKQFEWIKKANFILPRRYLARRALIITGVQKYDRYYFGVSVFLLGDYCWEFMVSWFNLIKLTKCSRDDLTGISAVVVIVPYRNVERVSKRCGLPIIFLTYAAALLKS